VLDRVEDNAVHDKLTRVKYWRRATADELAAWHRRAVDALDPAGPT
jgi:hypothetical protein